MSRFRTLIIISLFCLLTFGVGSTGSYARQAGGNQAGLVLQFPDGATQTYCLEFEGDTITGLDLLLKTGLDVKVEVQGLGALVCSIGATGCDYPAQTCVCQSYGPGGVYWTYHHLQDGKWKASISGASTYKVKPGSVEGWAWSSGSPPPVYTFEQLCQPVTPPTQTPEPPAPPTDTATPGPTDTPEVVATDTRVVAPTDTAVVQDPTNTRVVQPTATVGPPTIEPEVIATATEVPGTATATAVVEPSATETSTAVATDMPEPTATATATNTNTAVPTATQTVIVATATAVPTATIAPAAPASSSEDAARTIGFVIAGTVLVGLGIWGAFAMMRRRGASGDGGTE